MRFAEARRTILRGRTSKLVRRITVIAAKEADVATIKRRSDRGNRWEVRYRDPTQMGKVYVLPAGVERPVPGFGGTEQGPDADSPGLTLDVWRERIRRHETG